MIIDYHEVENGTGGEMNIYAGVQFEDEPDTLYVVNIIADSNGRVIEWKLLFNGFDCDYYFKENEKLELQNRLLQDNIVIHDAK